MKTELAEREKLEALRQEQERERKAAERRAEELQRECDQRAAEERAVLAAEQRKLEAERPHREKMLAIATHLDSIEVEEGPFAKQVVTLLGLTADAIRELVNGD